jgi:diadenylate cyclase
MISEQVLINIFWKNTPLHDGALIIRNDRVAAAACVLPSTEKPIGGELGTRHRAAVGASEVTDATIVVVSEETGSMSVAMGGKLRKNLSINELKATLMNLVDNPTPIRKRIKGKGRKK